MGNIKLWQVFCVDGTVVLDADCVYSSWAARTQQSLEFPKGDPLETGISATILTPGLAVALYTTSQTDITNGDKF
jgi:hypothetical protein